MYGADITVVGMYPYLRCGLLAVHIHSVILLACMPLLFPTFQWSACKTICRNELLSTSYFFVWDFAVIDEDESETTEDHEVRMKNIRWHLAEGLLHCLGVWLANHMVLYIQLYMTFLAFLWSIASNV
jgi:hypothetical protein